MNLRFETCVFALGFTRTTRGSTRTTRGFTRTTDYLVQFVFFSGMLMYCWSVIYYLSNAHSQSWYHKNLCWFVAPINESLHLVTWLIARSNTFRSKMHCNAVNFVFYVSFHRLSILDSPNTIISEHCVLCLWLCTGNPIFHKNSSDVGVPVIKYSSILIHPRDLRKCPDLLDCISWNEFEILNCSC